MRVLTITRKNLLLKKSINILIDRYKFTSFQKDIKITVKILLDVSEDFSLI